MLGDHPFDQASDAERLRASCAIAMRGDAKLRVLRLRDGSLLDEDSLRLLGEMAEAEDWQVLGRAGRHVRQGRHRYRGWAGGEAMSDTKALAKVLSAPPSPLLEKLGLDRRADRRP